MKKLLTTMMMVLCMTIVFAQAPEKFSYQAVVRNTSNQLVTNAPVGVRVSILQGSADGNAVYVETHTAATNANGLLTVEIGGGKTEQGSFGSISWADGPYFLKTETDPNGGGDYSITSTQQLLSVPYALYAKEAANGFSGDYNDLKNKPAIPQNVGDLPNDAGYITLGDLPAQPKGAVNDAGVVQTTACGEVDLCEMASQLAELQQMRAALLPSVTTGAVSYVTENTAKCGGTVTAIGYSEVTACGVCWGTEPNPTVSSSHTSNGSGTGTFSSSISGLTAGTTYYVRAYATNSVGTAYGNEVSFTTADACAAITLPYSENFESYTTSTTASTGVQPACWQLAQEYVAMTDANRPQLYCKSSYAHSGNYSLLLNYRGVYAMPALSEDVTVNQVKLEMYLRQPKSYYLLEVGVCEENGTFVPVAQFNNSTTNVERVECDFSSYHGNGRRIAFRNVLGGGANYNYSYNYIDDITLTDMEECAITLPYAEDFESYTTSTSTSTGVRPTCWELVQEDVTMTDATRPQLYYKSSYAHSGSYTLRMGYRCVYAMPALSADVQMNQVKLEMYLRQANAAYQLEVGVWDDVTRTFERVQLVNNSTTNVEHVTCDFSNYTGNGRRIAFRNVLGGGANYNYSYNYIDDITLDIRDGLPCFDTPTVTDHEGNVYATVQIGDQCWTKENLRTTTSPSTGTYLIPAAGTNDTYTGKQAFWYNNASATYAPLNYGLLYNWNAAVDTFNTAYGETSVNSNSSNAVSVTFSGHRRGICPAGWHLPSDVEWTQLTNYVSSQSEYQCGGNSSNIAKALACTEGWNTNTNTCVVGNDPSTNNATGFSAVPAGECYGSSFGGAGYAAGFWGATQGASYSGNAYGRYLYCDYTHVSRSSYSKDYGCSVRCLRD